MTYQQAEDKIIQAYFRDEIKPMNCKYCICGTLNNGNIAWAFYEDSSFPYTHDEFSNIEEALLDKIWVDWSESEYENQLFKGMVAALEVLKQIHKDRGEEVDARPFVKRQLVK